MKKIFTFILVLCSFLSFSQSTTLVISQVYGGGGNSGAPFLADFVELHNISATAQSTAGLSVQYASAANTGTWSGVVVLPAASIPAGGYFLVRMSATGATGVALPTPDANPVTGAEVAMSSSTGRVALVNGTTAISACPTTVIDLVGFGGSVCFEGTIIPALSNTTAALRKAAGCTETNNNNNDFTVGAPAPRNSSTPVSLCGSAPTPAAVTVSGTVNDFGNVVILTSSTSQTFNIAGTDLTGAPGNITITAPSADFTVSTDNVTFISSVTIAYTSATLAATPVYVRFNPQTVGVKTGNVIINGGGITAPVTVAVSGTGINSAPPTGSQVRISQVYGGGGNAAGTGTPPTPAATYNQDFVELYNSGTTPVDISGWSVQYASATGPSGLGDWTGAIVPSNTTIGAGKYFLVAFAAASSTVGIALPAADLTGPVSTNLSGSAGKVVLANTSTLLNGTTACSNAAVVDVFGFSSSNSVASCSEGTAFLSTGVDNTKSLFRKNNGCTDTNNNSADFEVLTVAPRNSATPANVCGSTATPALVTAGTINDFGSIAELTSSASQSFTVSGTNLTGAPGVITITAPSTDFQVSNDNITFLPSTTIAYTAATLAATPVYVKFTPQTVGVKTGNITITGGGTSTAITIAVSGTGVSATAPAATTTALPGFSDVCTNTTVGTNSFTINAVNLTTADVTVAALAGFSYAVNAAGPFTNTLTLAQPGGTFTQEIYVQFTPAAVQSYNGNIAIAGGGLAAPVNVAASGAGVSTVATLTTGAATAVTITTATAAGSITADGCTAVTVYGIEYSTANNFPTGTGTKVASTNIAAGSFTSALSGLTGATTYYYRAYATNAGGTAYGAQLQFTTVAPPPAVLSSNTLAAFGSVCLPNSVGPYSLILGGANLTTAPVTVAALAGYSYSTTSGGTYTPTLSIAQPGGTFSQTIYVKFVPTAAAAYNGNIVVAGGGAAAINIAVSGTGTNTPPAVSTVAASTINPTAATVNGTITAAGCNAVTLQGFEYSSISGFATGQGTTVIVYGAGPSDFSLALSGLAPASTYYYKAFAQSASGRIYGAQMTFTTAGIPAGLIVYSTPVVRGGTLRYSLNTIKPGHYAAALYNMAGQKVFKKEMLVQLGFVNDSFVLPNSIPSGVYIFQIENYEFKIRKQIIIK